MPCDSAQSQPGIVSAVRTLGEFQLQVLQPSQWEHCTQSHGAFACSRPQQDTKKACPLWIVSHYQQGREATLKGALMFHPKPQLLAWMEPTAWNVFQPGLPWPWSPLDWLLIGWLWVARCNGLHVIPWTCRAPPWHAAFCDWLLKDLVKVGACRGGRAPIFPWCIISWKNTTDTAVDIQEEPSLQAPHLDQVPFNTERLVISSTHSAPLKASAFLSSVLYFYCLSFTEGYDNCGTLFFPHCW